MGGQLDELCARWIERITHLCVRSIGSLILIASHTDIEYLYHAN